ncbi:hypothetical protein FXO38_25919 [Capsicum annuum]|uniref:Uncharacterized protein n=1 Tax=Capsicum annuum TaxID=4072 RepID=A0A2G2YI34_CAPAN|nr:hypothetical protein FXO38_25919 [Capsicum annuum]KAF3659869.1 hypothetical protein FXO37_13777 [Capsicum annuum]PHT69412.1 hypothetical protein T459_28899 [Capsicum annuum]
MMHHSDSHQELQYFLRRSVKNLIARRKGESVKSIRGITGADRLTDLTSDPEYVATCTMLMAQKKKKFVKFCKNSKGVTKIDLEGFGVIDVLYLRRHPRHVVQQAFELKMMIAAYWKIVFSPQKFGHHEIEVQIVNDQMALLHMRFTAYWRFALGLEKFVNEIEDELLVDLIAAHGGGFESSLHESMMADKSFRLKESVKFLEEMKEVVAKIMDSLAHHVGSEKA